MKMNVDDILRYGVPNNRNQVLHALLEKLGHQKLYVHTQNTEITDLRTNQSCPRHRTSGEMTLGRKNLKQARAKWTSIKREMTTMKKQKGS